MKIAKWSQVVGTGLKPPRWERPLLVFAALCASEIIWLTLAPDAWRASADADYSLRFFQIPPAWVWLEFILADLLLAILAALVFGLVRNIFAIPLLALVNSLLWTGIYYLLFSAAQPESLRNEYPFWNSFRVYYLVRGFVWTLIFFAALELTMRLIKNLPLALLLGAVASSLLIFPLNLLLPKLFIKSSSEIGVMLLFLPFNILGQVLFALTLWGGLRLTAGRAPLDEVPFEPRISRGFYLGTLSVTHGVTLLICCAIYIILGFTKFWSAREASDLMPVFLLIGLAALLVIYGTVVFCLLIYKMWQAIQDGYARTTPGWAVGGLFIPFYNLYWMFQVFPGFATDYNGFAWRHGLPAPRLSAGVFTAYAIITLAAALPYINLLLLPASYVLLLVMVAQICRAVNALPVGPFAPTPPPPPWMPPPPPPWAFNNPPGGYYR